MTRPIEACSPISCPCAQGLDLDHAQCAHWANSRVIEPLAMSGPTFAVRSRSCGGGGWWHQDQLHI